MNNKQIQLGDKVKIITKMDGDISATKQGTIIKSVNPESYPFTLKHINNGISPVYAENLNEWHFIGSFNQPDNFIKEKVIKYE